jgi:hypothetical protein
MFVVKICGAHVAKLKKCVRSPHFSSAIGFLRGGWGGGEVLGALTHLPTQVPIAQVRALSGRQCSAENDRSAKGAGSATRCILYFFSYPGKMFFCCYSRT